MQAPPPPDDQPASRWIAVTAAGALLMAAIWLAVSGQGNLGEREALAALESYRCLLEADEPAEGLPATVGLGRLVLEGAELEFSGPEQARLRLADVRLISTDGSERPDLAAALRRGLARGLRSAAESEFSAPDGTLRSGVSLAIEGEREPISAGQNFTLHLLPAGLRLDWQAPNGLSGSRELPWNPPDRRSILPPLVAIALAIATRKPILALFCGVLVGSVLVELRLGSGHLQALGAGTAGVFTHYIYNKLVDGDSLQIVAFVVLMLAMVGNLTLNGGIRGLMDRLSLFARGPRSTQITTYVTGLLIFFDDYASTILVGSTMRPLTDRFKVAREKLAYLVDSTSAPVAGLSLFSTWIAFEVSTFAAQLPAAGLQSSDGYGVFMQTLPYRFYCWFTLAFLAMVVISGRDFGPMLTAERRARQLGQVLRPGAKPMVSSHSTALEMPAGVKPAAWRALVPVTAFILVTLFEIGRRGGAFSLAPAELFTLQGITGVLNEGSGNWPLMIGSLVGFALAVAGTLQAGLQTKHVLQASWATLRSMGVALGILYLAWSIGDACGDLGTAPYLALQIDGVLAPALLPVTLFLLAGLIAFATGTSWGTMSILLPLVVGLAYQMGTGTSIGPLGLMVISIGAVLEGAIFGDHCSPISDTTVLSSISSASDHLDHVRTQMPYALVTMAVAIAVGYLPTVLLGWSPFVCLGLGLGTLLALLLLIGKRADGVTAAG
jgi:Na+/H+ antiporter NhaC